MDARSFDTLSRQLAGARSRRNVFAAFGGALLAGFVTSEASAKPDKVSICHHDDLGGWHYITVAAKAVPAHLAHGDAVSPDFSSDPNHCGSCGNACDPGATCDNGTCTVVCTAAFEEGCLQDSDCCQDTGHTICADPEFHLGYVCLHAPGVPCDLSYPVGCASGICTTVGVPPEGSPVCA